MGEGTDHKRRVEGEARQVAAYAGQGYTAKQFSFLDKMGGTV